MSPQNRLRTELRTFKVNFFLAMNAKEVATWENLDPHICWSLGCCSLEDESTQINHCIIIPRLQRQLTTLDSMKYSFVSLNNF